MMKQLRTLILALFVLAACTTGSGEGSVQLPTATLAFIVSQTPRYTATPVPTRTPLPTFTFTPSITPIPPTPTLSPTPTEEPPTIGVVMSLETVNVREGPGGSYSAIYALKPGSGVEVIGQNPEGTWYNIEFENDEGFKVQGWIFSNLVRVLPSPTPIPTATPSPDLTRLFLGTPLPTALLGGGTVTPTPPRSVQSPSAATLAAPTRTPTQSSLGIPVIDVGSINLTATALASGIIAPPTQPTRSIGLTDLAPSAVTGAPATPRATPIPGSGQVQEKVNVFALCDDPSQGIDAPTNLAAGSTIVVYWAWYAKTESQIQDHLDAASYEVRVDGKLLQNIMQ